MLRTLAFGLVVGGTLSGANLAAPDFFPEPKPTTPADAIELLCPDLDFRGQCVRAQLGAFPPRALARKPGDRWAAELLSTGGSDPGRIEFHGPGRIIIRHAPEDLSSRSIANPDHRGDRTLDPVESTLAGLHQAWTLLVGQLELPAPRLSEVVITELGEGVDGYFVLAGGRSDSGRIVLDSTPAGGPEGLRRATIRQYAYASAVGLNFGVAPGWAEAFSTWASIAIDGLGPDADSALSHRLRRLDAGLLAPGPDLAAGNALWFAFIEQAYGLNAVRATVEELSGAQPVAVALDRALRQGTRDDLASAFREFHLWCVLTGNRSDGQHFTFAEKLASPGFVTEAHGLPALSVHRESPIDSLGAAQIRLLPHESAGGMRVHFEGDVSADWSVDLVLVNDRGLKHRVPVSISPERRGEVIVPLDHLQEAWLLVRNTGSDDGTAQRYTYFANFEPGFPLEMTELRARRSRDMKGGVVVAWNTAVEHDLVGFNVLRRVDDADADQTINPVWIPALGGFSEETSYRYVDRTAEPGVAYVYRIQAITTAGLSSYSETVNVAPAGRHDRP